MTSGQVYAFQASVAGHDRLRWFSQDGDPYPGGRWRGSAAADTEFRTWVSTGTGGVFTVASGGSVEIGTTAPGHLLERVVMLR